MQYEGKRLQRQKLSVYLQPFLYGEMLEWLKRHAWKACIRQNRISGSNPDLSARQETGAYVPGRQTGWARIWPILSVVSPLPMSHVPNNGLPGRGKIILAAAHFMSCRAESPWQSVFYSPIQDKIRSFCVSLYKEYTSLKSKGLEELPRFRVMSWQPFQLP